MQGKSGRQPTQLWLLGWWLVGLLLPGTLWGQAAGAELSGEVRGFADEPLAGVTLIFHHLQQNQQWRFETDATGAFQGRGLPPGRYRLAVLQEGRILWVVSGVELGGFPAARLDVNLSELRRAAEAPPVLDVALQRRLQQYEQEQARRMRVRDHYRQGMQALEQQQYETAIREFEAARDLEPSEALYHAQLGQAYAGVGRTVDARAAYQAALALAPNDFGIRNNLGVALARGGRTEEAVAAFSAAVRGAGEEAASVYFNWGATLYNAGRYAEAAERFRQTTRSDKGDPMAFYFLGVSLYRSAETQSEGETDKPEPPSGTVEAFQRYLALAPQGEYAEQAADYLKRLGVAASR